MACAFVLTRNERKPNEKPVRNQARAEDQAHPRRANVERATSVVPQRELMPRLPDPLPGHRLANGTGCRFAVATESTKSRPTSGKRKNVANIKALP